MFLTIPSHLRAQLALVPTHLHSAVRLVATVRKSAASTPLAMKQRDEDAADAVSSRQHVHGEDAEPAMAAAHHFDKARHWLTSLQSIQQRGGLSAQNAQFRGRPSTTVAECGGDRC